MQALKKILFQNSYFFLPLLAYWVLGIIGLAYYGKSALHLWFDEHHYTAIDFLFQYATHLGDGGLIILVVMVLFLLKKKDLALTLLFAYLASTVLVQAIKFYLPDNSRPYIYFYGVDLYRVKGVALLADGSFPSGHSSGACCLFFFLASLVKDNWIKCLFGVLAAFACLTRVYLNQHFLLDTIVGGFIGAGAMVFFEYFELGRRFRKDKTPLQ